MGIARSQIDLGKYIKADEAWYGIDRTEGGLGLKVPVRSDAILHGKSVEAQLILNIACDLLDYCRRTHRGNRVVKDADNLELDVICGENPTTSGVRLIDAGATMRDPYYLRVFMNKTFGINSITVTWGMCPDERLLPDYLSDLKSRFGNGSRPNDAKADLNAHE